MSNNLLTIYWTIITVPERQTYANLLWSPPSSLLSSLPPAHDSTSVFGNYRLCSGAQDILKHTYVLTHPVTSTVDVKGDFLQPQIQSLDNAWYSDSASLKNRYRINYDYSWAFFCQEPVTMRITPPYMHNTTDKLGGALATGSFDISKWFRPVNLTYMLWENSNSITVTKGDPAVYIEFLTDKKIVLKQFTCNQEVLSTAQQVIESNAFFSLLPLSARYERFLSSNRHKHILKLIKENLLD